ncbi:hypothetical protein MNBD_GAMMA16-12 [hydrothermal vent metagenome]|uniref:Ferredoxin n=1 Tax=hydrothermal vent metagenome TaxID=652676 RepID=A0A3B0ZG20_9ZZZZ
MKTSILKNKLVGFEFPIYLWRLLQFISVSIVLIGIVGLFIQPETTLFFIWFVLIPIIPLLLFVSPGLWRNLCPIAVINQLPRMAGAGENIRVPPWFVTHSGIISLCLFVLIVSCRKILFNDNAVALACLLIVILLIAMFMGIRYKGKSGWCTSICPMLPVERLYGQGAFIDFAHSHCQPCVACTKSCSDLQPKSQRSALPTHNQRDKKPIPYFACFASIFPGFIFAYYLAPNPIMSDWLEIGRMYSYFVVFCSISACFFFLAKLLLQVSLRRMTIFYGAAAFNIYYWFNASLISSHFPLALQYEADIAIRISAGFLSLLWLLRAYRKTVYISSNSVPIYNNTRSVSMQILPSEKSSKRLKPIGS